MAAVAKRQHMIDLSLEDDEEQHLDVSVIVNDPLTLSSLSTLDPGKWLNDAVIDSALDLFTLDCKDKVVVFSTHFYSMLQLNRDVSRWYKPELSATDNKMLLFPMNVGGCHWVLAVANIRKRRIQYYDSLPYNKRDAEYCLRPIYNYLCSKVKGVDWKLAYRVNDAPSQRNGVDCGVFLCMNARLVIEEFVTNKNKHLDMCYGQGDIPKIREMLKEELAEFLKLHT
jgi:sentrin-specific protease 1